MADVYATLADGGWRNSADRDHEGRVPGRPRRHELGQAAPREGAQRRRHRRGDGASSTRTSRAAPRRARRSAARRPPRPAPPANWSTRGSTATRRILDGRVDGLPEQARVDDRRPRRAPAGRLPAGGNLARLHGRRSPKASRARRCNESNAGITYSPFYGKYAATGQAIAAQQNEESESKQAAPASRRARSSTARPAPHGASRAPQRRAAPPANAPPTEQTGGGGAGRPHSARGRPRPRRGALVV